MRDALTVNKHLVEIDISNNRINWEGAPFIAELLEKNHYLEILRVSVINYEHSNFAVLVVWHSFCFYIRGKFYLMPLAITCVHD